MVVYIDESGDHTLDPLAMDPNYKVFVLGAVCFEDDTYKKFDEDFRNLKRKVFGTDEYIIHTAQITRPSNYKCAITDKFKNKEFRNNFYREFNKLISITAFKLISCTVKKDRHIEQYKELANNPYYFSLENIINRILWKCHAREYFIYPEERSESENIKLQIEFLKIKTIGTIFHSAKEINEKIIQFSLVKKQENHSGSQLIDLLVTPIGRRVANYKPKLNNEISIESFKSKFPPKCFTIFP